MIPRFTRTAWCIAAGVLVWLFLRKKRVQLPPTPEGKPYQDPPPPNIIETTRATDEGPSQADLEELLRSMPLPDPPTLDLPPVDDGFEGGGGGRSGGGGVGRTV